MSKDVGVWVDHKKAVIVSIAAGEVTTRTLTSDIGAHPHYSGSQEGGGEKKYEQRHNEDLDRYYDESREIDETALDIDRDEPHAIWSPTSDPFEPADDAPLHGDGEQSSPGALGRMLTGVQRGDRLVESCSGSIGKTSAAVYTDVVL